jgi:hypothetical protein
VVGLQVVRMCWQREKLFPYQNQTLFEPESVILTGSYTYTGCISQKKFLKFLITNSSDCVTQTLGYIKVEMNKLQMITYKNGKESGSLLA